MFVQKNFQPLLLFCGDGVITEIWAMFFLKILELRWGHSKPLHSIIFVVKTSRCLGSQIPDGKMAL